MVVPDVAEATSSEGGYKRARGCNWSDGAKTTLLQLWERYGLVYKIDGSLRGRYGIVCVSVFLFFFFFSQVQLSYEGEKLWVKLYIAAVSGKHIKVFSR